MKADKLDGYVRYVAANYLSKIEPEERYKQETLAQALKSARHAMLRSDANWLGLVTKAICHNENNIVSWRKQGDIKAWMSEKNTSARAAMHALWIPQERPVEQRVEGFDSRLPESRLSKRSWGTRCNIASYLLMGMNPERYPPYQKRVFRKTYEELGHPVPPPRDRKASAEYRYALDFLDALLAEFRKRGVETLRNRLEAQSAVWYVHQNYFKLEKPLPESDDGRLLPVPAMSHQILNTILYGPPGTGKTWNTVNLAVAIAEGQMIADVVAEDRSTVKKKFDAYRDSGRIEMVTFHQNYTYEDFVEGIRPVLSRGVAAEEDEKAESVLQYQVVPGALQAIAKRAENNHDCRYVLIIDEINRGNIARIFGELITLIEDSKRLGSPDETRVRLPVSKITFGLPSNLFFVGTMNTADRSIALLDSALRRRFVFQEMMPDPSLLESFTTQTEGADEVIDCKKILTAMNYRIATLLDREHQIGHTYFLAIDSLQSLKDAFQHKILPLLQEYFFDDWTKIRAVLNSNGFVTEKSVPEELRHMTAPHQKLYDRLPVDDTRWDDPAVYQAIYGKPSNA